MTRCFELLAPTWCSAGRTRPNLAREAGQSALLDVTHSATLDDLSFPQWRAFGGGRGGSADRTLKGRALRRR